MSLVTYAIIRFHMALRTLLFRFVNPYSNRGVVLRRTYRVMPSVPGEFRESVSREHSTRWLLSLAGIPCAVLNDRWQSPTLGCYLLTGSRISISMPDH